jgi:DeoR/GlpR family transcriptional regulator of sugar metabolism
MATARRDLDYLVNEGKIHRVRGGATLEETAPPELPVILRMNDQSTEKEKIGATAASLIEENETIFLGSGTTVLEVAKHIPILKNLTVITNSLLVVNALATREEINMVILGGIFRNSEQTMYGNFSEQNISQVNPTKVFLGFRAISIKHGITNDFLPEVSTDQAIINSGKETIITADYTKFNRVSTVFVQSLSKVNKIITDSRTPADVIATIIEIGPEVIIAE